MAVKIALSIVALLLMLSTAAADTYRLDANGVEASFEVVRFGVRWVRAHFRDIAGDFVVDRSGLVVGVNIEIGTASVECDDPQWNARLRSAEWLDVQRFPQMVYRASHVERIAGQAIASGDLTLHGMTHPVVLDVSLDGCSRSAGSQGDCHFRAHGHIRRSDFGLPHGLWTGGDQVDISMSGTARDLIP